jgi:Rrf2 family protein
VLGIGRHTDYAARIVLHLAALPAGAQVTAAQIASSRLLPPAFIRRIIGKLAAAGIVRTSRGAGGGVSLARPAAEISLLDVVTAMEGGLVLNACVDSPTACPLAESCPVQKAWTRATATLAESLGEVRFDALADPTEMHVTRHGYPARHGRADSAASPSAGRRRR